MSAPLWVCPDCGARLAGKNMSHSCGSHTVEDFLEGKGDKALRLWKALLEKVAECGPFELAPAKTRIALMVRVRFLAVTALSDQGITFHLWLREPIDSPKVFRIDQPGPRAYIHWIRTTSPEQLDDDLHRLICASYRVGSAEA